jgi:DNA-binding YbaB/EbfC family protein
VSNPKQMQQMMKQAQQLQADMAAAQDELANETVEGSAGGGVVTAVVTGSGELRSVSIKPEVVDPDDIETLEDLFVAAMNDALRRAQELQSERLGGLTGGLDLGGLFG